jgi:hypothetical protein
MQKIIVGNTDKTQDENVQKTKEQPFSSPPTNIQKTEKKGGKNICCFVLPLTKQNEAVNC